MTHSPPEPESSEGKAIAVSWHAGLLHVALVVLLLAEIGIVRVHFNTDRFIGDDRAWSKLLLLTRHAAPLGIAAFSAWLLISWNLLAAEYVSLARKSRRIASMGVRVCLHIAVFAAFYLLTRWTFVALDASTTPTALAWVAIWAIAALAVPMSAVSIAFPVRRLGASLRRIMPSLLIAVGIGVGALVLGQVVLASGSWYPLLMATTRLASRILTVITGDPAEVETVGEDGFILGTGTFRVLITRECSGFEGLALTWAFLAAYFVWFRQSLRFPHVLVLVPVASLLVWLLNGLRVALLVWIGDRFSPEAAIEGFHSYAGWIVFCVLSLSVAFVSRRIAWFAAAPLATDREVMADSVNPAALYLGPFLGMLAVSFLTGAFSSGLDVLYPLRVVAGAGLLWWARRELPRARLVVSRIGIFYGTAAFVLWIMLERLGVQVRDPAPAQELQQLPTVAAATWLAFRAIAFLVIVPVVEELAFRGFLIRRLVSPNFESVPYRAITPLAWAVSSLAFGLMHSQWIAGTLAGALFGLALMRSGRLNDAIVAHITTNLLLLVAAFVTGPWHSWL